MPEKGQKITPCKGTVSDRGHHPHNEAHTCIRATPRAAAIARAHWEEISHQAGLLNRSEGGK